MVEQVTQALAATLRAELPDWQVSAERGGTIRRDFVFADFAQAFAFMTRVALVAESSASAAPSARSTSRSRSSTSPTSRGRAPRP